MTPERVAELIQGGESLSVEFKSDRNSTLSDADLIDAVVCMANTSGEGPSWVLIGVEDDGQISGISASAGSPFSNELRVQSLISGRTVPAVSAEARVIELQSKRILAIEVPRSSRPVGTSSGRYLRRIIGGDRKPACVPFHYHEMQSASIGRGELDYSGIPIAGVGIDAVDPLEIERFRGAIDSSRGRADGALLGLEDADLLRALGAIGNGSDAASIRVLALLLFGREDALASAIPSHQVSFQVLSGTEVTVNETWRWPLLKVLDELLTRFRAHYKEREILVGANRVAIPNYSEAAVREAIANALIHRDYGRIGAINVQLRNGELRISNPGGFPSGVRIDNLLATPPISRNPLLADALKRGGFVERTSRGVLLIFRDQLRAGHPKPSYELSTNEYVTLQMFGGDEDLDFARFIAEESQAGRPMSTESLLLLDLLKRRPEISLGEAAAQIHASQTGAESELSRLQSARLIRQVTTTTGIRYRLGLSAASRLRSMAGRRQNAESRAEMIAVVMHHVLEHGSISRAQVASMFGLTNAQAYRLLQRMVSERSLVRVGTRGRNVRYEPVRTAGQLQLLQ